MNKDQGAHDRIWQVISDMTTGDENVLDKLADMATKGGKDTVALLLKVFEHNRADATFITNSLLENAKKKIEKLEAENEQLRKQLTDVHDRIIWLYYGGKLWEGPNE